MFITYYAFMNMIYDMIYDWRSAFICLRPSPFEAAAYLRLQIYQDSVLDLLGGLQLTLMAANQEQGDFNLYLPRGCKTRNL